MIEQGFKMPGTPLHDRESGDISVEARKEAIKLEAEAGLKPYNVFPEEIPKEEETLIIVQRNAKDLRPADLENGALDPEWANRAKEGFLTELEGDENKDAFSKAIESYQEQILGTDVEVGALIPIAALEMYINTLRNYYGLFKRAMSEVNQEPNLTESEREVEKQKALKSIKILVVASDVILITPAGKTSDHMRGMETGQTKIDAINVLLDIVGADKKQLLNSESFTGDEGPFPYSVLKDLRMFEQTPKSMEFAEWLKKESAARGMNFWAAYEIDPDWVQEKRHELGIEGQVDIAERIRYAVTKFKEVSDEIHAKEPGTRMVVDMTTAYDTISPFSRAMLDMKVDDPLAVPYGAGVAIMVDKAGKASTSLFGDEYSVELSS